jgi:sulfoxide reductase catalytic subunit YedY
MPSIHRRKRWHVCGLSETPESRLQEWENCDGQTRRNWLRQALGTAAIGGLAAASMNVLGERAPADELSTELGSQFFPAKRNEQFQLDRPITNEKAAGKYNNFYEFTETKRVAAYVRYWQLGEWKLQVTGLVEKPLSLTMDELGEQFPYEERLYRHRCVETWAMAVPWTGFPMKKLIDAVRPLSSVKYVRFVSFDHSKAKGARRKSTIEPWPYTEGLTIAEAANELTMLVTGIYGHPLPKQHGPPVRLVVPWKYGFKSGKSLVRIEFTTNRPATFWNTLQPDEYDFVANVNPNVSHPRWSQVSEWDIGTRDRRPTLPFNGYGELVADMYQ